MSKRFVVGDIHGSCKALVQCLEKCDFDRKFDTLFCLGDVADSGPEVPETFEVLYKIKNLIYIVGNHDEWMRDYLDKPNYSHPDIWLSQGGQQTVDAYAGKPEKIKRDIQFLRYDACYHHLTNDRMLFIHGGYAFRNDDVLGSTSNSEKCWDRGLIYRAIEGWSQGRLKLDEFTDVFIGHTSVNGLKHKFPKHGIKKDTPFTVYNLHNIDTGAGWEGRLTIMDVDTKEFWQSDEVWLLYAEHTFRS